VTNSTLTAAPTSHICFIRVLLVNFYG
jgi:hypothetical protein